MYNLLISLGVGIVVTIFVGWLVDMPNISVGAGLIPGFIVMIGLFIYRGRKTAKKLEALMLRVQAELQPKVPTQKVDKARFDRAIEVLKEGYKLKRWQFLVGAQINGQIGQLLYLKKDFDAAEPYLESTVLRNWVAKGMLAVLYFKRKQYDKMRELFEKTIKVAKKESFLWNLHAYCLWKSGSRNDAIDVLSKGLEILKDDERLITNRQALQKNKKMKMRGWQEMWYQFHLDTPPTPKMQIDRRSMYRGI